MTEHPHSVEPHGGCLASRRAPQEGPRSGMKGFTLIELLVSIGIIAILAALTLPALNNARRSAGLVKCTSALQQWGQGFQLYCNDHDGFLPEQAEVSADSNTQWQEMIAPYVIGDAGTANYRRFVLRQKLRCPYAQADGIVYGGNTYLRPTQYSKAPPKIVSINQKLSDFVLLAENYTGEFWTTAPFTGKGGNPARIDYTRHTVGGKNVANILFADFHIEPLSYQQTLDRPAITLP